MFSTLSGSAGCVHPDIYAHLNETICTYMLLGMFCRIPGIPLGYDLMVGFVSLMYVMVGLTACHRMQGSCTGRIQ